MKKIKCFLGLHNPLSCFRYSDIEDKDERDVDLNWQGIWAYHTRVIYNSPWSLFATIETQYRCVDCRRKFWYARIDFEQLKTDARWITDEGMLLDK